MKILDVLYVIVAGILEGITEWLPISSTGHLILLNAFFSANISQDVFTDDFFELFAVLIQVGAVFAVVVTYFKRLVPLNFSKSIKRIKVIDDFSKKDKYLIWIKVLIAIAPVGIIGVIFDKEINELFYNPLTVSITLILYGLIFLLVELKKKTITINNLKALTIKHAFLIGLIQTLSIIPGTSRSGVTIIAAIFLSCSKEVSTEFSFYLSIPTIMGASIVKFVKFGSYNTLSNNQMVLLTISVLVSFLVSMLVLKWLVNYVKDHGFKWFGIYRIILGIALILLMVLKVLPIL